MKKFPSLVLSILVCLVFFLNLAPKTLSDELDDINKQINELTEALNLSVKATKPLESQLKTMQQDIANIKQKVSIIESDIAIKKKNIDEGYKNLAEKQKILSLAIADFYIKSYYDSPLLIFFSVGSASEITQLLAYQKAATNQDKAIITNIALSISDLETKKASLENEQVRLVAIKKDLDEQSAKLDGIVKGAKTYQSSLSSKIAELSARQREILGQRLASLNIPRSAATSLSGCVDDRDKDPGFSPRLAFFTYGVPNRVGMNQYGALGRAKAGQNEETILRAYYDNFELKKDYDSGITINVEGHGSFNIEDYVKRIYEMPDSWTDNGLAALKAQAIAARSYALAYTNNGQGSICATQQCQVFKPEPKGGNWEQAVNETRGWVMVQGGSPVKAWYSSTHGGYVLSSSEIGWSSTSWTKHGVDTSSGNVGSFSDLAGSAYDKDSPWFYCDWGSRAAYNKTAWLKSEEVSDIVNIILLARADSGTKEHLYQTDKPNPAGTDTWNEDKVKQELKGRGITPYNTVSDVNIDWDKGAGKTASVTVSGDAGSASFAGSEFKDWFNLRAPANIQIVGPLYTVERR